MTLSKLSRAISEEEWTQATKMITGEPDCARIWSKRDGLFDGSVETKVLPIHEAVMSKAPLKFIKVLIKAYPDSLTKGDTAHSRLPLHCACRANADLEVIELLVEKNIGACLTEDSHGRMPLHYALTNGASPEVLHTLINAAPEAAKGCDTAGWTPAHVALKVDARTSIVKELLDSNPAAAHMRTDRGTSIRQCIPKTSENKEELMDVVMEAKEKTNPVRESKMSMV